MTLDPRKQAHIVANRAVQRVGRTTVVAAVYRTAYGGQTAISLELILKQQGSSEPAVVDQTGKATAEYIAELPMEVDPRPIAYLALTPVSNGVAALDAASIAAAVQLEIVAYRRSGLVPNRWQLTLRRLR
jgi:hypothetical protein